MYEVSKTQESAQERINNGFRENYAKQCGISLKQVCEAYARNAETMLAMYSRAIKHPTGKYNGFTAAELLENHIYYKSLAKSPDDYVYPVPTSIETCNYFDEVMGMLGLTGKKLATIKSIVRNALSPPVG